MQQTAPPPLTTNGYRWRIMVLFVLLGGLILIALWVGRIPQPLDYHNFADDRTMVGIPNALNVLSNLPFVIFGAMGLFYMFRMSDEDSRRAFLDRWNRLSYWIMFAFVLLTGIGSSYYHANPINSTLYWDRLPLTVVFMAFMAIVIGERIGAKHGARLLGPLIFLGMASVTYWIWSEARELGDMRFYALVQFGGVLMITVLLPLFPSRYTRGMDFYIVLGWYMLAKALEHSDVTIYDFLGKQVSGHTLKHLTAAMATLWLIRMLKDRRLLSTANSAESQDTTVPSTDSAQTTDAES